jgi:hypothetical protein
MQIDFNSSKSVRMASLKTAFGASRPFIGAISKGRSCPAAEQQAFRVAMTTSQVEQVGAANNAKLLSRARTWRSCRLYGGGRHPVAIIISEMATDINHHVRNLLVARHAADGGHAAQPVQDHAQREFGRRW